MTAAIHFLTVCTDGTVFQNFQKKVVDLRSRMVKEDMELDDGSNVRMTKRFLHCPPVHGDFFVICFCLDIFAY